MKSSDRVLFARVGWMNFYSGIVPGDLSLIGGGAYNETAIGSEVLNFAHHQGRMYGFVQGVRDSSLSLERIDPVGQQLDSLDRTLVIFVSRRTDGAGQVIVGWYWNAVVLREYRDDPRRSSARYGRVYNLVAARRNAVLLPTNERWESVPVGAGAFGQSNVCYPRELGGALKTRGWVKRAIAYVRTYTGSNLVTNRHIETENQAAERAEAVEAAGQGQGFASTPAQRRAIEKHAMARAHAYFCKKYDVKDVSKQKGVLDLRCGRNGRTRIHVEVKGTTTLGASVILTPPEVARARRGAVALYVLHSIKLNGAKAQGGEERVIHPWDISKGRLKALNFTYKLP